MKPLLGQLTDYYIPTPISVGISSTSILHSLLNSMHTPQYTTEPMGTCSKQLS